MLKKLILRVGSGSPKLYTDQMTFSAIEKFAVDYFKLKENGVQLIFQDDEGDHITVGTNQELETMLEIFQDREYIKVNVEGINIKEEQEIRTTETSEPQPTNVPESKEKPKEISFKPIKKGRKELSESELEEKRKKRQERQQMKEQKRMEMREKKEEKMKKREFRSISKESPRHKSLGDNSIENLTRMQEVLNAMVTKLVDQRVKHLLPCLKEKILKGEDDILPIQSDMVHNGFQCKGCSIIPMRGIRYSCPKCPNFNLCQKCEQIIEHDHNLLKIKKAEENQDLDDNFRLFRRCFRNLGKRHHRRQPSDSHSKERCPKKGKFMKKLWGLSFMFGGEPIDYKDYVDAHQDIKPRQVFKKWAQEHGVSDEQFKKKIVAMKCHKLSLMFGKDPQVYESIVAANSERTPKELMDILFEKGIEKRGDKKPWQFYRRRFNFQDACKFESPKKEEKKECSPEAVKFQVSASLLADPKPLDKPQIAREKGGILLKLVEIFGEDSKPEMAKHINDNFKQGENKIIDLWINKMCKP